MQKREREYSYEHVAARVMRIRRLYSRLGEPLPADIIIDLHRHLAPALEEVSTRKRRCRRRREA